MFEQKIFYFIAQTLCEPFFYLVRLSFYLNSSPILKLVQSRRFRKIKPFEFPKKVLMFV